MSKKLSPEDAFYESLTLGIARTLNNIPRICNVQCEHRQPCEKAQVSNWEQRHSVYLPEDMKKFYLSTDGFILQWSFQYSANEIKRVGYIHFPHLLQITLLRENIEAVYLTPTPSTSATDPLAAPLPQPPTNDQWGNPTPIITTKTKIFEINNINDMGKVCMIYESTGTNNPKFYLLELATFRWQFLAETFSEYLRMCIAHLGLPFWELCFSSFGLPSWIEQLFLLIAPHLLEEYDRRRGRIIKPAPENPYNILDTNIFRLKPKGTSKPNVARKQ